MKFAVPRRYSSLPTRLTAYSTHTQTVHFSNCACVLFDDSFTMAENCWNWPCFVPTFRVSQVQINLNSGWFFLHFVMFFHFVSVFSVFSVFFCFFSFFQFFPVFFSCLYFCFLFPTRAAHVHDLACLFLSLALWLQRKSWKIETGKLPEIVHWRHTVQRYSTRIVIIQTPDRGLEL